MKLASYCAMFVPVFLQIGPLVQSLKVTEKYTNTHTQKGALISLFSFLKEWKIG